MQANGSVLQFFFRGLATRLFEFASFQSAVFFPLLLHPIITRFVRSSTNYSVQHTRSNGMTYNMSDASQSFSISRNSSDPERSQIFSEYCRVQNLLPIWKQNAKSNRLFLESPRNMWRLKKPAVLAELVSATEMQMRIAFLLRKMRNNCTPYGSTPYLQVH